MEPEMVVDYVSYTGENPLWHPIEKRLYWIDTRARLYWFDPATGESAAYDMDQRHGGFTIQPDGALLLFRENGNVALWRNGAVVQNVIEGLPEAQGARFNDVIADPEGRIFCGMLPAEGSSDPGCLYRMDADRTFTRVVDDIWLTNGLAFTPSYTGLYYTDTKVNRIYLFDYDRATGALSNQRVFSEAAPEDGMPDGMTVDAEGFVWSARVGASCLIRYAPDGTEDRRVDFPTPQVTSLIFGGDDLTDIYVTTRGGHDKEPRDHLAGALFRVNLGIRGLPEFFSRIAV